VTVLFAIIFEDEPSLGDAVRRQHMSAHLAFLQRNAAVFEAAGPLRDEAGEAVGGLWLVDAADYAAVEKLVQEDPLWSTGLRRSVCIRQWKQVFANSTPVTNVH
jgi:uncharacterized protein